MFVTPILTMTDYLNLHYQQRIMNIMNILLLRTNLEQYYKEGNSNIIALHCSCFVYSNVLLKTTLIKIIK